MNRIITCPEHGILTQREVVCNPTLKYVICSKCYEEPTGTTFTPIKVESYNPSKLKHNLNDSSWYD